MKRRIKLTPAKLYGKFMGVLVGVADKNALDIIENQQKALDYSIEENRVLKELLEEATGKKRVSVRDSHRRRLAVKAIALNVHVLANIVTIFQPQTLLRWHRDLVRKNIPKEVCRNIIARLHLKLLMKSCG